LNITVTVGKLSDRAIAGINSRAEERKRSPPTSPNDKRFYSGSATCVGNCEGSGSFLKTSELLALSAVLEGSRDQTITAYRGQYYTLNWNTLYIRVMVGTDEAVPVLNIAHWMFAQVTRNNQYACASTYNAAAAAVWQWPSWSYDGENRPLEFCVLGENACWNDSNGFCRL
jgi:hypothetical protein